MGLMVLTGGLAAAPAPMSSGQSEVRWLPLTLSTGEAAGFERIAPTTSGVNFTNVLLESRHLTNQILLNGSGVAAGDVDGDGWCDLYFCHAYGTNALFRNLGHQRFERVEDAGGAGCIGLVSTGATLVDVDGDGDLDLIVNTLGNGTRLFYNQGAGQFLEASDHLNPDRGAMTSTLADVDGDGDLDLYVSNYRTSGLMDIPNARATFARVNGQLVIESLNGLPSTHPSLTNRFRVGPRGDIQELGEPDQLFLNDGHGRFAPVAFTEGAFLDEDGQPLREPLRDWGLSAAFHDVNGDHLPDLYVCNDFQTEDRLWINQGQGRFRLIARTALRHTSRFSMAVDFSDLNRDGRDDFLVLDMMSRDHTQRMRYQNDLPPLPEELRAITGRPQCEHNVLQLQREDGTFAEIAQLAGVEAAEWAWSCAFLDVDLDGYEDLLIANGMERAARDMDVAERMKSMRASRRMSDAAVFQARLMFPRLATSNLLFRNRGDLTFEETGAAWGFDTTGVSQGMALADLDNDGDLDVVLNNLNDAAGLYFNRSTAPRVAIRLRGAAPNTAAIGARIEVDAPGLPTQTKEITAGGRYLSGDDAMRTFAAGSALEQPLAIRVLWPSGATTALTDARPNRLYVIPEPAERKILPSTAGSPRKTWFADLSDRLQHQHVDQDFDDFSPQPLLPRKLSSSGPSLAWADLDGDGLDDLCVGAGVGGRLAVFRSSGPDRFEPWIDGAWNPIQEQDLLGLVVVPGDDGSPELLAAVSEVEMGRAQGSALLRIRPTSDQAQEAAPASSTSPGPVAVADIDGDGDLDVFLGGRVLPGRYPAPASSTLLLRVEKGYTVDAGSLSLLKDIGLVNGACFTDLEGDGDPDLVLACDWGPLRVLRNDQGRFRDATEAWGLADLTGWWNGVVAADFDGDGRLDLAASNWGRNTAYEAFRAASLRLYWADFDGDGTVELIEAHRDPVLGQMVPARKLSVLAESLPFLRERFPTHRAFSQASVEDLLGDFLTQTQHLEARWLESTVLLNRGDHFEARPLPLEAQFAPAFGICAGDADGDGHQDLFLAQCFFGIQPELSRHDAGRGLWLRGDGQGGFTTISGDESGIKLYGEGRGAALADFDADGRVDLAVGQNGGRTALFRNTGARPGLRVRLRGPARNPHAIGAAVRLQTASGYGPVQLYSAGSGYGSQDGSVRVLTAPAPATAVSVRWMNGRTVSYALPTDPYPNEVEIRWEGGMVIPGAQGGARRP